MEEMSKTGRIGIAAMKAGMDRKTARKYVEAGKLPAELSKPRDWRTRNDPFEAHWPDLEERLRTTPGLEAKTLFEKLQEEHPGRYEEGQLRTLQRRVKRWRAQQGPDKEVMLAQRHRPGEAAQTDFTSGTELGVSLGGVLFAHLLCVVVLPFSNWFWATVCSSESLAALRKGVQRALFQLGRVPTYHQTDNSTAATHPVGKEKREREGQRTYNEEYLALMRHLGMTPRTTEVGEKEQNGDVESRNGVLKRQLEQALLLRGSRDFEDAAHWQAFVDQVANKANRSRGARVAEELAVMRELRVDRLPEFKEETVRVSEWSTIRVKHCAYSVPSRLIGELVRVRLYEERLDVYHEGQLQLSCERLLGRNQRRIDYHHVIWSLVRKPGGFARYVYREEMFPTVTFRRAYDALQAHSAGLKGDLEYLRILHRAASSSQADVEAALLLLLEEGSRLTADAVTALTAKEPPSAEVPALAVLEVDLSSYDTLLEEVAA